MSELIVKPASEAKWDCASFGEVMLRFDPGSACSCIYRRNASRFSRLRCTTWPERTLSATW